MGRKGLSNILVEKIEINHFLIRLNSKAYSPNTMEHDK